MKRTATILEPSAPAGVQLDAVYPHPPERVWRALTDPRALSRWLLPGDFAPQVGHRFTFHGGRQGRVRGEVVSVEERRRLAYTWQPDGEPLSVVTWTLEPVDGGRATRIRLTHTGLHACAGHRGGADWLTHLRRALTSRPLLVPLTHSRTLTRSHS